jgi:flagellar hook-basal body complex protein FliE
MKEITILNTKELLPAFSPGKPEVVPQQDKVDFGDMLQDAIGKVNQLHTQADQAIQNLATGQTNDIHNTMISIEKAGTSFKLMMQVRNKILTAYQEIMRIQV